MGVNRWMRVDRWLVGVDRWLVGVNRWLLGRVGLRVWLRRRKRIWLLRKIYNLSRVIICLWLLKRIAHRLSRRITRWGRGGVARRVRSSTRLPSAVRVHGAAAEARLEDGQDSADTHEHCVTTQCQ